MAQAKKKQSTKTAKKTVSTKTRSTTKKTCSRSASCKCNKNSQQDKFHVYTVTALSLIAGILLCADAAMMMAA